MQTITALELKFSVLIQVRECQIKQSNSLIKTQTCFRAVMSGLNHCLPSKINNRNKMKDVSRFNQVGLIIK